MSGAAVKWWWVGLLLPSYINVNKTKHNSPQIVSSEAASEVVVSVISLRIEAKYYAGLLL